MDYIVIQKEEVKIIRLDAKVKYFTAQADKANKLMDKTRELMLLKAINRCLSLKTKILEVLTSKNK